MEKIKLSNGTIIYLAEDGFFTLDKKKSVENTKIPKDANNVYSNLVKIVGRDLITKLIQKDDKAIKQINDWLNNVSGHKAFFTKNRFINEVYRC